MHNLVFLTYVFQKLLKKNLWGWLDPPPLVQEGLKTYEILKVSYDFNICSVVQISRNLGVSCNWKTCYILENKPSTLEKF